MCPLSTWLARHILLLNTGNIFVYIFFKLGVWVFGKNVIIISTTNKNHHILRGFINCSFFFLLQYLCQIVFHIHMLNVYLCHSIKTSYMGSGKSTWNYAEGKIVEYSLKHPETGYSLNIWAIVWLLNWFHIRLNFTTCDAVNKGIS